MQEEQEKIREDDICPICLTLLYKPIRLKTCLHIFCEPCIDQATNTYDHKKCPLCRTAFSHENKQNLQQKWKQIQKQYPDQIKTRELTIKDEIYYRVQVGNLIKVLDTQANNKYLWTLFVNPAPGQKPLSEVAEKIQIRLHPTFHPSVITFKASQTIKLNRTGWGTFGIDVKIYWKSPLAGFTQLTHDLKFEEKVSSIKACKIHKIQ